MASCMWKPIIVYLAVLKHSKW